MDDTGLEHTAKSKQKTAILEKGGAESDARNVPIDPDLALVKEVER